MDSNFQVGGRGNAGNGCAGVGVALFFALIFGFFLLLGLVGEVGGMMYFMDRAHTRTWTQTPCEILSGRIVSPGEDGNKDGTNYRFEVQYRYTVQGRDYTTGKMTRQVQDFEDYSKVQRLALVYAPGVKGICYVNPAVPTEAVLEHESLWLGFVLLIPLIFVAIGLGGLYFVRYIVRQYRRAAKGEELPVAPLSYKVPPSYKASAWYLNLRFFFFGFFLLIGSGFLFVMAIQPLWLIANARSWPSVPCKIIQSSVRSHSGSDGPSYSVNILYAYRIEGREYRANRYHFMGSFSNSGRANKAAVVKLHPAGSEAFCYVNPKDPTDAVLVRGFTSDMWWGFFPLPFVAVGLGGIIYTLRYRRKDSTSPFMGMNSTSIVSTSGKGRRSWSSTQEEATSEAKILQPTVSPVGNLIGQILVAVIWNAILSNFVLDAVKGWRAGHGDWIWSIFLIPFVLIGLAIIGSAITTFLSLFNPKPKLTLVPGTPSLGSVLVVKWELFGRTQVVRRLCLRLEGREEATYSRGTNTSTDKEVFAKFELVNATDRLAIRSGQARFTLPANQMHSWASNHNKIIWSIHVHGEIACWPDLKVEFPVTVLPPKPSSAHVP